MKFSSRLFCTLILAATSTSLAEAAKIGYGSATAVTSERVQEQFFMGFTLGFEVKTKQLNLAPPKDLLVERRLADNSPLSATKAANELIENGAVALFGFPTSHEALLAADVAMNKKMLAVFAGASHSDLAKKGASVFTTGTTMKRGTEVMVDFIAKTFVKKKGLAIINPFAVFSVNQEQALKDVLKSNTYGAVKMQYAHLNKELELNQADLEELKSGRIDYLFVTPYPDDLFRFFNQLAVNRIDLPLTASASWATADPEVVIQRFLLQSKAPFYMSSEWLRGQPESVEFERQLKTRYHRDALPEIAYGYDAGVIAATLWGRVIKKKQELSSETLISAMQENPCFDGLTVGKFCFSKTGGHALRPVFILRFTKGGFVRVPTALAKIEKGVR